MINTALSGINSDDVIKAISKDLNAQRQNQPGYKKAAAVAKVTELTDEVKISSIVANQQEKTRLLRQINSTPKGAALLNKYLTSINSKLKEGQKPITAQKLTNNQLQNVVTQADNLKEENVLNRQQLSENVKLTQQNIDESKDRISQGKRQLELREREINDNYGLKRSELDLARVQAANTNLIQTRQLDLQESAQQGELTRQQELLNHQTAIANKNTDLQLALAQMNRADRSEDREFDRERDTRDRRQALMLMLMQGLGNIGKNFGAGL